MLTLGCGINDGIVLLLDGEPLAVLALTQIQTKSGGCRIGIRAPANIRIKRWQVMSDEERKDTENKFAVSQGKEKSQITWQKRNSES